MKQPKRLFRQFKAVIGRGRREWGRAARRERASDAHLRPYPYQAQWEALRARLAASPPPAPSGVRREHYLDLVEGVAVFFRQHQAESGAIIDPYLKAEKQYSTPCYAYCAALLAQTGRRPELQASAERALDHALGTLVERRAADGHGDFFTFPACLAYELLRDLAPEAKRAHWERLLRAIRPEIAYSDLYFPRHQEVHNWNALAVAGEFLRHRAGYTGLGFVEYYLGEQLPRLTAAGMYRDPNEPMIYDHFPRYFLAAMLERGYAGRHRAALEMLMDRGELTSLLMQSPCGEMPAGGRSKQHQWGDAMQCATFELWAARKRRAGDMVSAGAFKRGAHLALRALQPWVRPSGELWVVKNYYEPEQRHGFESYSYHSTYNLLTASMLAFAYQAAEDEIAEGPAPCDLGGYLLDIPAFHKVIANAGGNYVELEVCADTFYDSTGLIRLHRAGVLPLIGPSDAGRAVAAKITWVGHGRQVQLEEGVRVVPSSFQVGWEEGGAWVSVAQLGQGDPLSVTVEAQELGPERVRFTVRYSVERAGTRTTLAEAYTLTADELRVSATVSGKQRLRLRLPVLASDGRRATTIAADGPAVTTALNGSRQELRVLDPAATLAVGEEEIPFRNGHLRLAEAIVQGDNVSYSVKLWADTPEHA